MNIRHYLGLFGILLLCTACPNDDDGTPPSIPIRDRGNQAALDDAKLQEYLSTHFYNYEAFANPPADFDYQIVFDTIAGDNAGKTPMIGQVTSKTLNRFETNQTIYVLTAREGVGYSPTFADSSLTRYRGQVIDTMATITTLFDSAVNPTWFDLTSTVEGFQHGIAGSKAGSGFMADPSGDGTTVFNNDYGVGAVFIPSGLGYFASPPPGTDIPLYASLVFTFDNLVSLEADHDNDGIRSIDENLDGNDFLFDEIDNTDGDALPNFRDGDDDNDGVRTRLEINFMTVMENGEEVEVFESFKDTDGDGTVDHLDTDDDGDGRLTMDEILFITNPDGTPGITYTDTDGDGIPDYLDSDS